MSEEPTNEATTAPPPGPITTGFTGEIRMFAGNFAPVGWLPCDGRIMPISENDALFTLIGTIYGGDGHTTFNLPNLAGHAAQCAGPQNALGKSGGEAMVSLTSGMIPGHSHAVLSTVDPATTSVPTDMIPASLTAAGTQSAYGSADPKGKIDESAVSGGGQGYPHENRQPYIVITYMICIDGIYPHQN